MRQPIDLVGGFYTDESLPWSVQDTVNYLPVAAEASGTRTPTKLVDAPGLRPWVAIGNTDGDPTAGAPIRGLHDVEGRLFVVSGRMLYEISQKGMAIPRGTIPGVGRVSMAHNQRGHGHELLVVNGSGGYVYNTATDTFTVVTDSGYPGAGIADFLDGYLMQVEPFGRFLFHSDLADALEYNTLDRFEAETQPDRVIGMIVNHQEVWAFGDRTIDVFGNAGTAQGTFQNKGVSISRGCIAKWSPAIIDNGVAWLGDDRVVYHARGYDPVRISTRAIEVALSECSLADIRNAFSFVWADRGHSVFYLTVPNGQTFGYDFSTGLWHRRASWHPERDISGRWCLADLVRHNGRWVGGDFRDGRLYQLDWDYMLEGCEPLIRERVSPVAHVDGRRFSVDSVELLYDTGGSESECFPFPSQPEGPKVSGGAPDGGIGFTYAGYTYTVTAGDAPVVSVEIVAGALPDGLTFTNGVISATQPLAGGTFSITIRATDSNGLWYDHQDSIFISPVLFLLFSSDNEGVWISQALENWSPMYPLVPSIGTGVSNATTAGGKLVLDVLDKSVGEQEFYTQSPLPPWASVIPLENTQKIQEATSVLPSRFYTSGEVVVAWEINRNFPYYWVSEDAGASYAQVAVPTGYDRIGGICRMASGRWIGAFQLGATNGLFYSDEEVPATWTLAASSGSPATSNSIASGEYGYFISTNDRLYRTEDGESWVQVNDLSALSIPSSPQLFVGSDGTIIIHGQNANQNVGVSHDRGETVNVIQFDNTGLQLGAHMSYVSEAGGLLLGSTGASAFFVSEDMGDSWSRYEPPFSGYGNAATIIAMDLSA